MKSLHQTYCMYVLTVAPSAQRALETPRCCNAYTSDTLSDTSPPPALSSTVNMTETSVCCSLELNIVLMCFNASRV